MMPFLSTNLTWALVLLLLVVAVVWWLKGWRNIGPNQQGFVEGNWAGKSLGRGSGRLIALQGERRYQARTLAPGWQWNPSCPRIDIKVWPLTAATRIPW